MLMFVGNRLKMPQDVNIRWKMLFKRFPKIVKRCGKEYEPASRGVNLVD
jgi:hypothetical protein